jgi:hypothetical protein
MVIKTLIWVKNASITHRILKVDSGIGQKV